MEYIDFEDGNGDMHELPALKVACDECGGAGHHAHAIDGNGITSSEWAEWDDDDRRDYLAGRYDKRCEVCDGTGTVLIPDPKKCDPALLDEYDDMESESYMSDAAERAAERRMMGY